MTVLEKAKEALKACPFCGGEADYSIGEKGDGTPWDYVECLECGASTEPEIWNKRAALEAEKPDNDAVSVVEQWSLEHMGKYESAQTANIDLARHIQQFAESYHAKKCADCKNKRPTYRPFGLDTPSEEQK